MDDDFWISFERRQKKERKGKVCLVNLDVLEGGGGEGERGDSFEWRLFERCLSVCHGGRPSDRGLRQICDLLLSYDHYGHHHFAHSLPPPRP
jgi:hypothetical protein